ncbi:MAG: InlB B-repeat-containing protein, partial [Oscillospiraceae bacterium]|nr:InlB B-repeat-containing protein [Oscillospiraceae bacterium]
MLKKTIRLILVLLLAVCLATDLNLSAVAAATEHTIGYFKIENDGVATVSVDGTSYKITVKDKTESKKENCDTVNYQTYQKSETTFTNTYGGNVTITYSISSTNTTSNLVSFVPGGEYEEGTTDTGEKTIIVPKDGTFTVLVQSSSNESIQTDTVGTNTCTFTFVDMVPEELPFTLTFVKPAAEQGTLKVTAADGTVYTGDGVAEFPLTASSTEEIAMAVTPKDGYEVLRWEITKSDGTVTVIGGKTTTVTYKPQFDGTITCVLLPKSSAMYSVNSAEYAYLDEAINAAKNASPKKIVVTRSGNVLHSDGIEKPTFEIPSDVMLVIPYASSDTGIKTDGSFRGNYAQGTSYSNQPAAVTSNEKLRLTIPAGTTVTNHGEILVGGTLQGNGAMSGDHANLCVDGTLELPSSTSILSACGYVYGNGMVSAMGNGAKIYQPLALLRNSSWGWSIGCAGASLGMGGGMQTWPSEGYSGINASPRYTTQNIQCKLVMKAGDTMYGYADQYASSKHYMTAVVLVGSDSSQSLIALNSGATLTSTYKGDVKSSLYSNVGKLTLEISGGATQGSMSLSMSGYTLKLNKWPFPVPYNYDLILKDGDYSLQYDLSLLPGAGLKVAEGATLTVPSGVHLAVYTAANDHSSTPAVKTDNSWTSKGYTSKTVSYNNGKPASPNYPANSTLSGPSGGSLMANLVVQGTGVLDVKSNAYLGGIVQTAGGGTVIMNGITSNASGKDYVFTGQMGLAGNCNEIGFDTDTWSHAGATIYKFYPQYFDENGVLQTMVSGTTYKAANASTNTVETFSFDLYPKNGTTTEVDAAKVTKTETVNAKPMGQWYVPATVTFDANGGEGTMEAMEVHSGVAFTLPANAFTYSGFDFKGWNTKADGTGDNYDDAAEITVTANTTLYAQWQEPDCKHENKDEHAEDPATCVDPGTKAYWTCANTECGKHFADAAGTTEISDLTKWLDTKVEEGGGLIPALGHDYTDVEVTYTWDEENYKSCEASRNCTRCYVEGGEPTETVSTTNITAEVTPATCKDKGKTTYTANFETEEEGAWVPDETSEEAEIAVDTVNGHSYGDPVFAWNSENTAATASVTCSVCAENTENKTKSLDVTMSDSVTTEGDCETNKVTTYTASVEWNGKTVTDSKEVTGDLGDHKWTDATCTTAKTCSVCKETEGEALGHNAEGTIDHKDATCTETGVVGGTYCTRCDNGKVAAEATIPALEHNTEGTVAHKDATCTEAGVVGGTYCTRCDNGKAAAEATIPALEHNTEGTVAHKDATCTEAGV